jgi:DNA-binding FadR family transcriptional regulator
VSGEASFLAAERASADDMRAIRDAAAAFDAVYQEVAPRRPADARLHTLIAQASKSSNLLREEIEIQEQLTGLIAALPNLASVVRSLPHSHDNIVNAICNRHAAAARDAMIGHVETSFDWVIALL